MIKKYRIREIRGIKGNILYYEVDKRSFETFFKWKWIITFFKFENALRYVGDDYVLETWKVGKDGKLEKNKIE